MTKVDITVGGHTIIIEADEPLDAVAAKALELFERTERPGMTVGFQAAGCSTERAPGPEYVSGHDADLGGTHG